MTSLLVQKQDVQCLLQRAKARHPIDLAQALPWRLAFTQWPRPLEQPDAVDFANHLLDEAGIVQQSFFSGSWQARVIERTVQVVDCGPTWPLLLSLPVVAASDNKPVCLQQLVSSWTSQALPHALNSWNQLQAIVVHLSQSRNSGHFKAISCRHSCCLFHDDTMKTKLPSKSDQSTRNSYKEMPTWMCIPGSANLINGACFRRQRLGLRAGW